VIYKLTEAVPLAVTENTGGTAITIGICIETPKTTMFAEAPSAGKAVTPALPDPATTGTIVIAMGVVPVFKKAQ
jgi:hypothetical protein